MKELIGQLVTQLSQKLLSRQWQCITAESCTGGGLSYALTSIPGSSNWFDRGLVTYSNNAKEEILGVQAATLATFGAVSQETVCEMAEGALQHSKAQLSIAITGIAGPEGGSKDKPVGTIWIAYASVSSNTHSYQILLSGNREEIREQTIQIALEKLLNYLACCSSS